MNNKKKKRNNKKKAFQTMVANEYCSLRHIDKVYPFLTTEIAMMLGLNR